MSNSTENTSRPADAQSIATDEFVRAILNRLKNDGGVHAETAVAAAATLAGTYLIRSFDLSLADRNYGDPITSSAANEEVPKLVATIVETLTALELPVDPEQVPARIAEEHQPQLTILQLQLMFGVPFRNTVYRLQLSDREAAFAGAAAAARIIKDCAPVLDPLIGFAIASAGCATAARTVPIDIPGEARGSNKGKPWYKFW